MFDNSLVKKLLEIIYSHILKCIYKYRVWSKCNWYDYGK